MTDFQPPEFPTPESPDEQEELVLWLLGELPPDQARRVARHWRHRPEEVERWRRFLSTTERIGTNLRLYAEKVGAHPKAISPAKPAGAERAPRHRRPLPTSRLTAREVLRMLRSQVPRRVVPVAILAPVVVVFVLWLTRTSFYQPPSANLAHLSILTPTVQIFDQGVALPSGPVKTGAQIRLEGQNPAARLSWSGNQCQAVVTGPAVLLVTEPNLGLIQQEGQAVYDVVARDHPLQLWTSQGNVEIAQGRIQLAGTASSLQYKVLDGSARMSATGEVLAAGSIGQWGRPLSNDLAAMGDYRPLLAVSSSSPQSSPETASSREGLATGAATTAPKPSGNKVLAASGPAALSSSKSARTGTHFLFGRVVRSDNTPVGGARLSLSLSGGDSRDTRWCDHLTTRTGPDGVFRFRNLPVGESASLRVNHDRLVSDQPSRRVDLDSTNLKIILFDSSSIAGRIVPPDDSVTLGRATIEVLQERGHEGEVSLEPLRTDDQRRLQMDISDPTFYIAGLAPGTYRLHVETEQGFTGDSSDVELGIEEARSGVDIPLRTGGLFVGRVVNGETLEGIPGATVQLFRISRRECREDRRESGRSRDKNGKRPSLTSTETPNTGEPGEIPNNAQPRYQMVCNDKGDFTINSIVPAQYEVRAAAQSFKESRMTVQIQAGATRQEVLSLFDEPAVVFGRVVDNQGLAIAGARVSAEQVPERLYDEQTASSDAQGRYELHIAQGKWALRAQAPQDKASWARESVEIERPSRVERNFVLFPGVRVYGTVTQAGRPVAKTRIYFAGEESRPDANSTRTDEAGHYEILLRQGQYALFIANQRRATLDLHDVAEYRQDIVIADNLINGTVTDADSGAPLPEARVILESTEDSAGPKSGPGLVDFFRRSRFEKTNRSGFYEFKSVEPGVYRVRASSEGYAETTVSGVTVGEGDENVLSVPVTLRLSTALLEVNFTDAETGKPVSHAIAWKVTSLKTGEESIVSARPHSSDRSGFYLITNLEPGTYSITFMQIGDDSHYLPVVYPHVEVVSDKTSKLDVALRKGGTLHVVVRRHADQDPTIFIPVPRVRVRLTPPPGATVTNLPLDEVTNTDGLAAFSPLPFGTYSIAVEAPGFSSTVVSASVEPGEPVEADVLLHSGKASSTGHAPNSSSH